MSGHPLILSLDLDEWYHCRWATGGPTALWKNPQACFRDYYGSDRPAGEIIEPTRRILEILNASGVRITFFILGETAEFYPELVREIAAEGHEIACHGMTHRDMTMMSRDEFANDLARARDILSGLSGQPVKGYRAANLVIADWLADVLLEQGFEYDSSVCAGRAIAGKYQGQSQVPANPYRIDGKDLLASGNGGLIEIPIPTFPVLKLPGAVSIATRVFGWPWTRLTLDSALKTGAACYYMHPYEFGVAPSLPSMPMFRSIYIKRVFLRRMGAYMERSLEKLINRYQGRITPFDSFVQDFREGMAGA